MSHPFFRNKAWHRLRYFVLKRDPGLRSPGCDQRSVAVDHIIERARGGPDHESNLRDCDPMPQRQTARPGAEGNGLPRRRRRAT